MLLSFFAFWTTVSPHDAFSAPLVHPHKWDHKWEDWSLNICRKSHVHVEQNRTRQRSREGVVQRRFRLKRCFWRVRSVLRRVQSVSAVNSLSHVAVHFHIFGRPLPRTPASPSPKGSFSFYRKGNRTLYPSNLGIIERAVPRQKSVCGRASGAKVRSGDVLRVVYIRLSKQGILIRIQTSLDTSRIRINARLRCVQRRFARGNPPSAGPPLRLFQQQSDSLTVPCWALIFFSFLFDFLCFSLLVKEFLAFLSVFPFIPKGLGEKARI